jgi:hypothetical protein
MSYFWKFLKVFLLNLTLILPVHAQTELSVANIPDSLKKDAYTVVRCDDVCFDVKSIRSGSEKVRKIITVLHRNGEKDAFFFYPASSFDELKSFSGKLYDAQGKLLRKYKMSDLYSTEYSRELASDAKLYVLECQAPSIPFTVEYEYEGKLEGGILSFGRFSPISTSHQSVQKGSYRLQVQESITPRIKSFNGMSAPTKSTKDGTITYVWQFENLNAIPLEKLAPPIKDFLPYVMMEPTEFTYDGFPGSMKDWLSIGQWNYDLTIGRDLVPEPLKSKILELTKNAKNDREKVRIVYDFLGATTRYVSIQLGIGGFRPMSAEEVYKTGFGDCKALTNYLKSMLSVVGVESNACDIRFSESDKRFYDDFPAFMANHVILMVPLKKDTLWLECTNTKVPFGFVHNGIAGHDALVCKATGSHLARLPDYPDSLNLEQFSARVNLTLEGNAEVRMHKRSRVKIYDDLIGFPSWKPSDQLDHLRSDIVLPNVTMGSLQIIDNKTELPEMEVTLTWSTSLYGNKTGNRMFLPVNVFRGGFDYLKTNKRMTDIKIDAGFLDADSILIVLPEGFEIESLPASFTEKTRYGNFSSSITTKDNNILIVQRAFLSSGYYKKSEYQDFQGFLNKITAAYKAKITLRKKAV